MPAVMCGIFSSSMSFAMDAARPIQASATVLGVKPLYAALPSYVIIMGGGGLVNFAYCFSRLIFKKELSLADLALPGATLLKNGRSRPPAASWVPPVLLLRVGRSQHPSQLRYVNWMLHMSGYVLFGGSGCAWRMGWCGLQTGSTALGRDASHYRSGQHRRTRYGLVAG